MPTPARTGRNSKRCSITAIASPAPSTTRSIAPPTSRSAGPTAPSSRPSRSFTRPQPVTACSWSTRPQRDRASASATASCIPCARASSQRRRSISAGTCRTTCRKDSTAIGDSAESKVIALSQATLHQGEQGFPALGDGREEARSVEPQRALGHRIAAIAADHEHLVRCDLDDHVAVALVVAAVLMIVVDPRLAGPAHQVAYLGRRCVQSHRPVSGILTLLDEVTNALGD